MTSHLPRPGQKRIEADIADIYTLAGEALQHARSPTERRDVFRTALLNAYEGGVSAQREMLQGWEPTPSAAAAEAPGGPPDVPGGVWKPPVEK